MAVTTIQSNNKLIKFTQEIGREFVRENLFSPYMGEDATAIIRRRFELKNGGEQMNIPLVTRLTGAAFRPARWSATKRRSTTTECGSGSIGLATPS
jgi:hypothetical protein